MCDENTLADRVDGLFYKLFDAFRVNPGLTKCLHPASVPRHRVRHLRSIPRVFSRLSGCCKGRGGVRQTWGKRRGRWSQHVIAFDHRTQLQLRDGVNNNCTIV